MRRWFMGWLLGLGGNALGLLLAWVIVPGFEIKGVIGFLVSLVVFAILSALFTWLMFRTLLRHAGSLVPLTGLASTFLALAVTVLLPIKDGIDISGWGWLWGTLVVWVLSMFIWVLPGPWRRYKKTGSAGRPSDGAGGTNPF